MEETGCEIICGAPSTLAVKELMMVMMMIMMMMMMMMMTWFSRAQSQIFKGDCGPFDLQRL